MHRANPGFRFTTSGLRSLHTVTVALSILWLVHGANLVVVLNIGLRVVLVFLLVVAVLSRSS
jgi:hypothetical protein